MALKRSAMKDKVRVITVTWEDETVEVGVYPGRYTPELVERVTDAVRQAEQAEDDAKAEAAVALVSDLTASVLAWWDVLDEDESRLPTTPEVIASLPLSFVSLVMTTAGQAVRPPTNRG